MGSGKCKLKLSLTGKVRDFVFFFVLEQAKYLTAVTYLTTYGNL